MRENKKGFKILFVIAFIFIFAYLIISINIFNKDSLFQFFTRERESISFDMFFTILITVLMVFFVPISWFTALGAFFFGLKGYLYVITGGIISSILSFFIAKIFKKDVIKIINKIYYRKNRDISLEQISEQIEKHGIAYVFFMRSMPFIPFNIANYVSGLSSISLKDYILGTILGLAPNQFITSYFFIKVIDIKENPIGTFLAAFIKGAYVFLIILWQRKNKYNTKE